MLNINELNTNLAMYTKTAFQYTFGQKCHFYKTHVTNVILVQGRPLCYINSANHPKKADLQRP